MTVWYSDESERRRVFPPADYENISDVRLLGDVLYVHYSITLFRREDRLAVFDLRRRKVVADRRVDRNDLK
jgi:hypothetical protein